MTTIGNHIRTNVHRNLRDRVRALYLDILQCKPMDAPIPDLDLFVFDNEFVMGVFYFDDTNLLSEGEHLKGAWLEIKANDAEGLKRKLIAFGVKEVVYPDKTRFFFQAPGGPGVSVGAGGWGYLIRGAVRLELLKLKAIE